MICAPLHTIRLHGRLAEFGEAHSLAVNSPREAVRALAMQLPGFGEAMREGLFRLVRGKNPDTGLHYETPYDAENNSYDVSMLDFSLGAPGGELHIVPVIAGAGGGGGKAILGAVIMVAAVVGATMVPGFQLAAGLVGPTISFGAAMSSTAFLGISYSSLAMFGGALMLAGIGALLQPSIKSNYGSRESPDQRASFFLGGQVNQASQGGPVILAYGRCRIGSTVVSAGLSAERITS